MSNQFGALTDHWGLLGASGALENKAKLVASSSKPAAKSVNRAQDANGDNVAEAEAGQTAAGTLEEVSCTYELSLSTLEINTLKLGEIIANGIAATLAISTSNSGWPQITMSGMLGTVTVVAPTGFLNTFSIPDDITLTNAKRAQLFDFTVDADCRLTGSSYNASVDIASADDGVGVIVAHGVSGGVLTQSCDLVAIDDVAVWTPGVTWIETQAPGADEGKAAWHTTSASAEKILERDADAEA